MQPADLGQVCIPYPHLLHQTITREITEPVVCQSDNRGPDLKIKEFWQVFKGLMGFKKVARTSWPDWVTYSRD